MAGEYIQNCFIKREIDKESRNSEVLLKKVNEGDFKSCSICPDSKICQDYISDKIKSVIDNNNNVELTQNEVLDK